MPIYIYTCMSEIKSVFGSFYLNWLNERIDHLLSSNEKLKCVCRIFFIETIMKLSVMVYDDMGLWYFSTFIKWS